MADSSNMARTTIRGTFWTYASYYSGKLMIFLSTIILARLLLKEDFGVAGYALVTINMLEMLGDHGIGHAVIYHQRDEKTADTAFWLGMGISLLLLALAWIVAPLAGDFFGDQRAVPVIRVLALSFPLAALGNVHDALLRKQLAFGRKFIPDVVKAFSKGITSIVLALLGFGAWSLIFGQVGGTLLAALAYWWALRWRPRLRFSPPIARQLLSYGLSIVGVNALAILLANLDYLLIGRFLGAGALGVYTLAFRIPELIILQFCSVIALVVFPVFTSLGKDDPQALRRGFLATTRYVAMITVPLGLTLALLAEPFVLSLFGERWREAVPVLRAIAIYATLLSLSYNAGDVYKAQGRPGLLSKLALVRLAVALPALWWAATTLGTITAVGWVQAGIALLAGILNLAVAARMLEVPALALAAALRPAALGGTVLVVATLGSLLVLGAAPPPLQLIAGLLAAALAYVATLWWLQRDVVLLAGSTLRTALGRR